MNKQKAMILLQMHSDFNDNNSFLHQIKEYCEIDQKKFHEIMECIIAISEDKIDIERFKSVYGIVFWCRAWLDSGILDKKMNLTTQKQLTIYTEIIESALFYLLQENVEEAFWSYNEFLDGRYE